MRNDTRRRNQSFMSFPKRKPAFSPARGNGKFGIRFSSGNLAGRVDPVHAAASKAADFLLAFCRPRSIPSLRQRRGRAMPHAGGALQLHSRLPETSRSLGLKSWRDAGFNFRSSGSSLTLPGLEFTAILSMSVDLRS